MTPPLVTRFAPSPTGYLHLGHVAHAIHVWGLASLMDARVLMRIEDHDSGRSRPEFEKEILADLEWLGLHWDGPVVRQSERTHVYEEHVRRLASAGLVYGCDCSRKAIEARSGAAGSGELRYDNHCRERGLGLLPGAGWRVRLPDSSLSFEDLRLGTQWQCPQEQCGDILIRERHGNWTYQFAVVVDDWLQGVNLVIRGEDLAASTGRQILLGQLLARYEPPMYNHHKLIMDCTTTQKLSKRDGAHAIREFRLAGTAPETVLGRAAHAVGLIVQERPLSASGLADLFRV